jgi:hypothetical protein
MENQNIYPDFISKTLGDYTVNTRYKNKPDLKKFKVVETIGNYHIYTSTHAGSYFIINETTEFYGLGNK